MGISPRQARILSDLSQQEVAAYLGVHRQTYMKWERNPDEMPVGKAKKFSQLVEKDVDQIFFGHESTLSRQIHQ